MPDAKMCREGILCAGFRLREVGTIRKFLPCSLVLPLSKPRYARVSLPDGISHALLCYRFPNVDLLSEDTLAREDLRRSLRMHR